MSGVMYQVTGLQVMDHMMVTIKLYSSDTGHWELVADRQMLVSHDAAEDLANDLDAIARAVRRAAQDADRP